MVYHYLQWAPDHVLEIDWMYFATYEDLLTYTVEEEILEYVIHYLQEEE